MTNLGQALSYEIGQLKIGGLRDKAEAEGGTILTSASTTTSCWKQEPCCFNCWRRRLMDGLGRVSRKK